MSGPAAGVLNSVQNSVDDCDGPVIGFCVYGARARRGPGLDVKPVFGAQVSPKPGGPRSEGGGFVYVLYLPEVCCLKSS